MTYYFDTASLALLQSNPLWLGGVEPIAVARYSSSAAVRSGIHAVAMDREFTGRAPAGIAMTSAGVTVAGRVSDGEIAAALAPSFEPPALQGISAAFSAVEGSVYMVGGRLPGGAAAGTVWEWSLDLRRWNLARVAPPVPSANVLSVGYAPGDAFILDFTRRELGGAVCVYQDGEKVVDLWGGLRDRASGAPWREDTMAIVHSTTKGFAAMVMALAHSRGCTGFYLDPHRVVVTSRMGVHLEGDPRDRALRDAIPVRAARPRTPAPVTPRRVEASGRRAEAEQVRSR